MTEHNVSKKSITMHFTPRIQPKTRVNKRVKTANCIKYSTEGIFRVFFVEILGTNIAALQQIGDYGCKSRSHTTCNINCEKSDNEEENECLILSLEEAFFLSYYMEILSILDENNEQLKWDQMLRAAQNVNPKFVECLASYLYLKSKGWTIKSGIKFGMNYLIYQQGPRFYHASFGVKLLISDQHNYFKTHNLKGLQRVAETSNKDLILLEINKPLNFQMNTLQDIFQLNISEIIIRRFNCTAYVQHFDTNTE